MLKLAREGNAEHLAHARWVLKLAREGNVVQFAAANWMLKLGRNDERRMIARLPLP